MTFGANCEDDAFMGPSVKGLGPISTGIRDGSRDGFTSSIVSNCELGAMDTELVVVPGVLVVLGATGTRQFAMVVFILTKCP